MIYNSIYEISIQVLRLLLCFSRPFHEKCFFLQLLTNVVDKIFSTKLKTTKTHCDIVEYHLLELYYLVAQDYIIQERLHKKRNLGYKVGQYLESMEGSVIQATRSLEFEDGGYWCHCGDCIKPRINSNTLLRCKLVLEGV